tara:strand:- start:234 stop:533 length:300 start_codon:yes stop_codon:yes gene_type:complete
MSKDNRIDNFLEELYFIIEKKAKRKTKKSYTNFLLKSGSKKIAKKIVEESEELVIDYIKGSKKRIIEETADLIYHIVVLLYSKKISIKDLENELKKRRK